MSGERTTSEAGRSPEGEATLPFASVAIIGLGLMGGSLARALRELSPSPEVIGFSPLPHERSAALSARAIDHAASTADDAAKSADLVVYAVPLSTTLSFLGAHAQLWRARAIISDVCSLKGALAARARELGVESRYVGAHPMAGGEATGFAASRADLYQNARVWLSGWLEPQARTRVQRFWSSVGARPAWTDAEAHDHLMVHASHLPQLVSNILADRLRLAGLTPTDLGPGGKDMTRLASSSSEMWRDLLAASAPMLAPALREMGNSLNDVAGSLEADDLDALVRLMERTRSWKAGRGDRGG